MNRILYLKYIPGLVLMSLFDLITVFILAILPSTSSIDKFVFERLSLILEFIISMILCRIFLKTSVYKHHIYALILIIIGLVLSINALFKDIKVAKLWIPLCEILCSPIYVILKYLMDSKFMSLYYILFGMGVISFYYYY